MRRRGVAAVEFAVVLPLLLLLLVGIWELGRIINVQITLNNAARDAARLGAQANLVSTFGTFTQIRYGSGTPDIDGAVRAYLQAAGITNLSGLTVEFQFVEPAVSGGPAPTSTTADPYTGLKNQRFRVRISIPYDNVRWTTLTVINPSTLTAETYWQCLVDDPFTVNTTLPGWSP
jgi:Flp pilus assembly protein TadG